MIRETATIIAIEDDSLLLEAVSKTTCGNCAAKQGCGQRLLSKLMAKPNAIRVPLRGKNATDYRLGDEVEIGVGEGALVNGALFVYLFPLLGLLLGGGVAQSLALGETGAICCGLGGLLIGAIGVRVHAWQRRSSDKYNPVLLD